MKVSCLRRSLIRAISSGMLVLSLAFLLPDTAWAAGGGSSNKDSAFGPGEHELQLPPIWVPVNVHKGRKGPPTYAPITVFLTSKDGGMMNMCYKLPYLIESFVFTLHDLNIKMDRKRNVIVSGLNSKLMEAAVKATDRQTVKSIKIVSGTPHPSGTNQDLLDLCR